MVKGGDGGGEWGWWGCGGGGGGGEEGGGGLDGPRRKGWVGEKKEVKGEGEGKVHRLHEVVHCYIFYVFTRWPLVRGCWCTCPLGNQREMDLYAADDHYFR